MRVVDVLSSRCSVEIGRESSKKSPYSIFYVCIRPPVSLSNQNSNSTQTETETKLADEVRLVFQNVPETLSNTDHGL